MSGENLVPSKNEEGSHGYFFFYSRSPCVMLNTKDFIIKPNLDMSSLIHFKYSVTKLKSNSSLQGKECG